MAKVLLINSNRFKHPWPIPFGLCYIATVLETDWNNEAHLLDLCFSSDCEEDIHEISKRFLFRFPNFYFYQKENITPGLILVFGNLLLKAAVHGLCIWDMRLNKIEIYCFSHRANQKAQESDTR